MLFFIFVRDKKQKKQKKKEKQMCELIKFKFTQEQREIYAVMYAKLLFYQYYNLLKNKKGLIQDKSVWTETFKDTNIEKLNKKRAEKDWTTLRCCDQFINNNKVLFPKFLEIVTASNGLFSFSIPPTTPDNLQIFQISKKILESEEKIPTPLLESLKFAVTRYSTLDVKLTMALTNLFYFSESENQKYFKENVETLRETVERNDTTSLQIKVSYLFNILFTFLVKQNICPHFPLFYAYFGCLEDCRGASASGGSKLQSSAVILTEWTNLGIEEWISQPSYKTNPKLREVWELNRPLLEEIKTVFFQLFFTFYILKLFHINISGLELFLPWRINKCRRVDGYDIYTTQNSKFQIPNLGNTLFFVTSTLEIDSGKSFEINGDDSNDMGSSITTLITNIKTKINAWKTPTIKVTNNPRVWTSSYLFDYQKEESEKKESLSSLLPVPLAVNEKTSIMEWLTNLETEWESSEAVTINSSKENIEIFLNTFFKNYKQDPIQLFNEKEEVFFKQQSNVSDLIIGNYYGLGNINNSSSGDQDEKKKIYIPRFVFDILFETNDSVEKDDILRTSLFTFDLSFPSLFGMKEEAGGIVVGIVDPEIEQLALTLKNISNVNNRYGFLLHSMTKNLGEFFTRMDDKIRYPISDRYDIEAKYLENRKQMRKYGMTFIHYLSKKYNIDLDERQWEIIKKLQEILSSHIEQSKDIDIHKLIEETLNLNKTNDFRKYLSSLMFLKFLSDDKEKKKSKPKKKISKRTTTTTTTTTKNKKKNNKF